jgi:hypothetical protein
MGVMAWRRTLERYRQSPAVRYSLLALGVLLLLITPLLAPFPGPGGIFTFALGLGLVLRNSIWAKRRYVRFKRAQPRLGGLADKGLMRNSPKRRKAREKADAAADDN